MSQHGLRIRSNETQRPHQVKNLIFFHSTTSIKNYKLTMVLFGRQNKRIIHKKKQIYKIKNF